MGGVRTAFAVAAVLAAPLRAQDRAGVVRGLVYDSVAARPVVGAMVQMVLAADPAAGLHNALSDSLGRYVIGDVAPGRYVIGFHHAALDSLALESPTRGAVIQGADTLEVNLAVASPATIVAAICGASGLADSTGMIIGLVEDARRRLPIAGATTEASWQEIIIDARGVTQTIRRSPGRTNENGWFAICNVPANVDVALSAAHGTDSTGLMQATVPLAGLARHDLLMGGVARIRGTVVNERWRAIRNARVTMLGRNRVAVTDSAGRFVLGEVPSGSQTLETRALGHAPDFQTLILPPDADSVFTIRLTTMQRVLDTIQVTAQRLFDRDTPGFLQRKRFGIGQFYDENDIRRRRPIDLLQLLQTAPSLRVGYAGMQRAVFMRGTTGLCKPTLWVDGMRFTGDDAADIDLFARPEEVAGIEIYRPGQVPAQFHNWGGCGAIVVWTKPRMRR